MRSWFRGKRGGLIAFLLIAVLVFGGLGWVTASALGLEAETRRLEQNQRDARATAERDAKELAEYHARLRMAVWQLDSWMLPILAHEANRPYYQYAPVFKPQYALVKEGEVWKPASVMQPSPLLNEELPDWMTIHFQVDESANWNSPQVFLNEEDRKAANQNKFNIDNVTGPREELLSRLRTTWTPKTLFDQLAVQEKRFLATYEIIWNLRNSTLPEQNKINPTLSLQPNPQAMEREYFSRWFQQRGQMSQNIYPVQQGQPIPGPYDPQDNPKRNSLSPEGIAVRVGPLSPMWMAKEDGTPALVVARSVEMGKQKLYQGILIDTAKLKDFLLPKVHDLFPDAELQAMTDESPKHPERAMTALPLELVPAAGSVPATAIRVDGDPFPADLVQPKSHGWSPLHSGLTIAWLAAIVALLAVGLGGYALMDHTERRMRFVSAVTHELRTPLTTLRLYLDMLTGGMVKDEQRRAEYLNTLNEETERLHRLVGNVLDFSRLEDHSPRLDLQTLEPQELLNQVQSNWETRCGAAGKQLVIENQLDSETRFVSDTALLRQLAGNLIDNAVKYSRTAEDPRIWLRLRSENKSHVILEVEDRGPGVPAHERGLIFEAFRQGRNAEVAATGGVGLGLALAARWAKLLGGELTLHSPSEGGACFRLRLAVR